MRCHEQHEGQGAIRHPALRGGKALEGEPQEWYRPPRSEGVGGSKPSRGRETLKAEHTGVGNPGTVDLRVDVAVGAVNLMRVVGAAQDSGGPVSVSPEGKPSLRKIVVLRHRIATHRKTTRP